MARIKAVNDWMKKYAAAEKHTSISTTFRRCRTRADCCSTELSADDLHPNAAGYAIMGPLAESAIKTALR